MRIERGCDGAEIAGLGVTERRRRVKAARRSRLLLRFLFLAGSDGGVLAAAHRVQAVEGILGLLGCGRAGREIDRLLIGVGSSRRNHVGHFVAFLLRFDGGGQCVAKHQPALRIFGVGGGGFLQRRNRVLHASFIAEHDSQIFPASGAGGWVERDGFIASGAGIGEFCLGCFRVRGCGSGIGIVGGQAGVVTGSRREIDGFLKRGSGIVVLIRAFVGGAEVGPNQGMIFYVLGALLGLGEFGDRRLAICSALFLQRAFLIGGSGAQLCAQIVGLGHGLHAVIKMQLHVLKFVLFLFALLYFFGAGSIGGHGSFDVQLIFVVLFRADDKFFREGEIVLGVGGGDDINPASHSQLHKLSVLIG